MVNNTRLMALVSRIYPEAVELVEPLLGTPSFLAARYYPSDDNEGAFCLVEQPDFHIAYLSFEKDVRDPAVFDDVSAHLVSAQRSSADKSLYFNIYGRNPAAMQFARQSGFTLDLWGLKMQYRGQFPAQSPSPMVGLQEKDDLDNDFEALMRLFDRGYAALTQGYEFSGPWASANPESFRRYLLNSQAQGGFRSYWLDSNLIGASLIQGIYLSDMVVSDDYQGRGFGREILIRCINLMLGELGRSQVRLNVEMTNGKARRLYESMQFVEIGCFADHTYRKQAPA